MKGKMKISSEEARKYAEYVMEHVFKGQSIAATLIALGTYILLDFINQPDRIDLFALGAVIIVGGYITNYIRARKKIQAATNG